MGVMFSIANAFAAALHTVGFAETVRDLLKVGTVSVPATKRDVRLRFSPTICP